MKILNVIPVDDKMEHINSASCHCIPVIEHGCNGILIIHNSYDQRETMEEELGYNKKDSWMLDTCNT